MVSINEAFPSNYLKAADLKGRNALVTIARADFEMIGDDKKLVLFFEGKDKGMVLNKTNAGNIAAAYGDDTDDWKGQQIVLFEAMVDYQGKTVAAIRVRQPMAKDRPAPARAAARPSSADIDENPAPRDMANDEIPF